MNYFYSDRGAEAEGPYSKAEILELLKGEAISDETLVCAEGKDEWFSITTLLERSSDTREIARPQRPVSQRALLPQVATLANSVSVRGSPYQTQHYLEILRQNSCYKTLRSVITIGTVMAFLSLFGFVAVGLLGASQINEDRSMTVPILYAMAFSVIGSVVIIAWRQASLLLVDLVDTQLDKNSRN
jgi:uncharacterized membrane protein (DUF485 family)